MVTTKINENLKSKQINCVVCNTEFKQIARQVTCNSKECRQINLMLNLKTKLRSGRIVLKNLREYWYFTQLKYNLLKYDDYEKFKLRMEALERWCKGATLNEIAKDVQQISNILTNKRI